MPDHMPPVNPATKLPDADAVRARAHDIQVRFQFVGMSVDRLIGALRMVVAYHLHPGHDKALARSMRNQRHAKRRVPHGRPASRPRRRRLPA